MVKRILAALLLLTTLAAICSAASEEGTVVEITTDSVSIQEGGAWTLKFVVSNELLTNTVSYFPGSSRAVKFPKVKRGDKVCLEFFNDGQRDVCIGIQLQLPDDTGTVTEVGQNTVTIRSDKGVVVTYRVRQDLVDNTRDRYESNYPSRFSEVKPGRRIEVSGYVEEGAFLVTGLDLREDKKEK